MFRAIGTVIILITLSNMFATAFAALERTMVASLGFVETAANTATSELIERS
tara:strand:- start:232 stop:387 length:156 start_codon:yes stop_codon:yes gene_type:complete